jgi:hypothetical protein
MLLGCFGLPSKENSRCMLIDDSIAAQLKYASIVINSVWLLIAFNSNFFLILYQMSYNNQCNRTFLLNLEKFYWIFFKNNKFGHSLK